MKKGNRKNMMIHTKASVRRLARQLVDLRDKKRREILCRLDTDTRTQVIERMCQIRSERNNNLSN